MKYRFQHTAVLDLNVLLRFCETKSIEIGYVVTKSLADFGLLKEVKNPNTQIMLIPAPLLCYWMGESELSRSDF